MSDAFLPLRRYFDFSGRSRRREFWLWLLVSMVAVAVLSYLDAVLGLGGAATTSSTASATDGYSVSFDFDLQGGMLAYVWLALTFIPNFAVSFRRLHDTDRSAWWLLIAFVPLVGIIVLLVFYCRGGTAGPNRFGADPKGRIALA